MNKRWEEGRKEGGSKKRKALAITKQRKPAAASVILRAQGKAEQLCLHLLQFTEARDGGGNCVRPASSKKSVY